MMYRLLELGLGYEARVGPIGFREHPINEVKVELVPALLAEIQSAGAITMLPPRSGAFAKLRAMVSPSDVEEF